MVSESEYPKIYSILFGEGLVNDAVSVIIYQSIPKIFDSKTRRFEFDIHVFGNLVYQFLSITFVSIMVGFMVGLTHCQLLKRLRYLSHKPLMEISLTIFCGLLTYSICEKFHQSGIIGKYS